MNKKLTAYAIVLLLFSIPVMSGCSSSSDSKFSYPDIPDQTSGAMNTINIAVSPGHGLSESTTTPGTYEYQRTEINGILEDTFTQEFCFNYLYPALERCGTQVIALRQRDRSVIGVSGEEEWKESSLLYLTAINAEAASVASVNDPIVRPWHAINMSADCYISIHFNNYNTTERGTSAYVWDQDILVADPDFTVLPAGSQLLSQTVYEYIIEGAEDNDSSWSGLGIFGSNFGELRILKEDYSAANSSIPGLLLELGFIDQIDDATALKSSSMQAAMARGILKGLIDRMGNPSLGYPPVRPQSVQAVTINKGIRVSWTEGVDPDDQDSSAAENYVVKISINNGVWWNMALVSSDKNSADIELPEHGTISVRVAARNDSGESIDSDSITVTY